MPCTQAQLETQAFQRWAVALGERPGHLHRKIWEWGFIAQVLSERGMLQSGRCGAGFAVGQEPLPALFASLGCDILATDLDGQQAASRGWVETGQHACALEDLNQRQLCPDEQFRDRVRFRVADMRALPRDLGSFDFVWSSCAMEHLGSLKAGVRFLTDALGLLNPGGVAVHTTEYNVSSNLLTRFRGDDVIYRRRDLIRLAVSLRRQGYIVELSFNTGSGPADRAIDTPPYHHDPHLKMRQGLFVATSYGLVIGKPKGAPGSD